MSLNFLSPVFMLGLVGIGLPILIHLFTKRQQTQIDFSAVFLLLQSQKRSIKKARPNRLLLLVLRCLAIAFLSLALAGPLFSMGDPEKLMPSASSSNILILDDSLSMSAQTENGDLFTSAKSQGKQWVEGMAPGSEFSLILASNPPKVQSQWTQNRESFLKTLDLIALSFRSTDVGGAFAEAKKLLETSKNSSKNIFIATDLTRSGWKSKIFPLSFDRLNAPQIQILDMSALQSVPNRIRVDTSKADQEFLANSRMIRVNAQLQNLLQDQDLQQVSLALWANGKKRSEVSAHFKKGESISKEFSIPYFEEEALKGFIEAEPDGLPLDNRHYFSFQPEQKVRVLVIDGDPKAAGQQSETYYVERALNPFSVSLSDIEPTVSTLSELTRRNLLDFHVLMLCNVRELPYGYEQTLESFVSRGGSLIISLGDQVDPKFYNEKLGNLLPVTLESLNQVSFEDEWFRFLIKPSEHPVLKVFSKKAWDGMRTIRFQSLYSVAPRDGKRYTVPLKFSNQFPAVVESQFGKGSVVLFTSSLDRDWNNFPIQPTFLPWVQRWVKYGARSLDNFSAQNLKVGDPWVSHEEGYTFFVKTPTGEVRRAEKVPNSTEVRFEDTWQPGIYQLFRLETVEPVSEDPKEKSETVYSLPLDAEAVGPFSVNIDPAETDPSKMSKKEIKNLFPGLSLEVLSPASDQDSVTPFHRINLTTPFLALMVLMIFGEGYLVRRE